MKKIFTKKNYGKPLLIGLLCVCAAFVFVFAGGKIFKRIKSQNDISDVASKEKYAGEMKSIIEYGEKINIAAHYPVTGNKSIDDDILKSVEEHITSFKNQLTENKDAVGDLYIDYNSYIINDRYISIAMNFNENISLYANEISNIKNSVYDIKTGKQLALNDVVENKQMGKLFDLIESGIKNNYSGGGESLRGDIENYIKEKPYSFYLTENSLVVMFEEYSILSGDQGMPFVSLSYDDVKDMLKKEFNVESVENQQTIEEDETVREGEIVSEVSRNIDPNRPMVALTFDDGPHPTYTKQILNELKKNDCAATFFVLGNRAVSYGDIVQEIIKSGCEVGNHSWSHVNYTKQSGDEIKKDKERTQNAVKGVVGRVPSIIRVPYGATNETVQNSVELPVVLWSVDTEDWKSKDADLIFQKATSNIKDGDIILMHDIQGKTAEAVPRIVKELKNQGFQLVTVSEMAKARNKQMENGKKYFSFKK